MRSTSLTRTPASTIAEGQPAATSDTARAHISRPAAWARWTCSPQHGGGQHHRDRRVERGHHRGDTEEALAGGQQEADRGQCAEDPRQHAAERRGRVRPPRLPQEGGDEHDDDTGHHLVEGERKQAGVLGDLGERDEQEPEAQPGQCAVDGPSGRGRARPGRVAGDEPDGRDRQDDADPDQQGRPLS